MRTMILQCAVAIGVTSAGCQTKVDVGVVGGDVDAQTSDANTTPPEAGASTRDASTPDASTPDATTEPSSLDGGRVTEDATTELDAPLDVGIVDACSADGYCPPVDGGTMPIVAGDGGACNTGSQIITGTKISVDVFWPQTAAIGVGAGKVSIWLLSRYTVAGATFGGANGKITGTVQTCGMQTPAISYTVAGSIAAGLPQGQTLVIRTDIPANSWDGTPATPITGEQGGSNIGSTFTIDPVVTLYGLTPTGSLADGSRPWPISASRLLSSDVAYADGGVYTGVGQPGILAAPLSTPPGYLFATSLDPTSPKADESFLAMRNQISLYGTLVSCTEQTGTATVTELNNRIVGCNIEGDGGACDASEYSFVDINFPQFAPGSATFDAKPLMPGAQCSDVLAALP